MCSCVIPLGELGVDGKVILKRGLKNMDVD